MAFFDTASNSVASTAQSTGSNASAAFGSLGSAASAGIRLGAALTNLSDPTRLLSQIRSLNLPRGGDPTGRIITSAASFGGSDANNDWRVRLTVPGGTIFDGSSIFAPLRAAGGLVFPYTPTINIGSTAKYDTVTPIHNNYSFQAFQSSSPDAIQVSAPYYVEDSSQAQYWIATVHFLRAVTKMFTGDATPAGNPPVICQLNGYGEYVFKNVPVVVTNFSVSLDAASDYISTVGSSNATGINRIAANAMQLAGVGQQIPAVSNAFNTASNVIGAAGAVTNFLRGGGLGGATSGSSSHVPTKSTFTIGLQPIYSRESVRTFNLQKFVNGDYMTSSGAGYV
jgi:hypothetical protein